MKKASLGVVPILLLVLVVVLQLVNIESRSLWFDEASSIRLSTVPTWTEMYARSLRDVHPPLFYCALKIWLDLAAPESALHVWARLFAVICNILFFFASFLFCRDLIKGKKDSAFPHAFFPLVCIGYFLSTRHLLEQGWSARMYGMGNLILVLAAMLLLRIIDSNSKHYKGKTVGFAIAIAAAAFTHYFLLFSIIALGCFVLWAYRLRDQINIPRERLVALLLSFIPVVVLYLAWLPMLQLQFAEVTRDYWSNSFKHDDILIGLGQLFFPSGVTFNINALRDWWTLIIFSAVLVFATFKKSGSHNVPLTLLLFLVIVPITLIFLLSHGSRSYFQPRALTFILPFFLMILSYLICSIPNKGWALVATLFTAVPLALNTGLQIYRDTIIEEQSGGSAHLARYVSINARPGDVAVITNPLTYISIEPYLKKLLPLYLITSKIPADHWQGGAFLKDGERHTPAFFNTLRAPRIWYIHSDGYQWKEEFVPPPTWARESHIVLQERIFFQGNVTGELLVPPHSMSLRGADWTALPWRYSYDVYAQDWSTPSYNDDEWLSGQTPFGNPSSPNGKVKTAWESDHLWLRSSFVMKSLPPRKLSLYVRYTGMFQVVINGILAGTDQGRKTGNREICIAPEALSSLRLGNNTIAIHVYEEQAKGFMDAELRPAVNCTLERTARPLRTP